MIMIIIMIIVMIRIMMTRILITIMRTQVNKNPNTHDNPRTAHGQFFVNAVGPPFGSPSEVPRISKKTHSKFQCGAMHAEIINT